MIGGLFKSTSRAAIVAAAGIIVGGVAMPSAKAADLGGDCCADLEERVAELEATTARKGNRKMSLTVTGQVHRMVLWWDDSHSSKAYYGLDNTNSSSRFAFIGSARVTPKVTVGFDITIEIEAGGTSSKVSQFDEDGKVGSQINGLAAGSFNGSNNDAYFGDARRANFYIEHKDLGRVTVGRGESAGAITTIDLGGIGVAASASVVLVNGSFLIRNSAGQYLAMNWAALGDPAANQGRTELVRYDSPTLAGFIFSASIGEAGDYWGAMLRYAGEFSGFRIAAGIGYESVSDRQTRANCFNLVAGAPAGQCATGAAGANAVAGPANLTELRPEIDAWGGGVSVMHVPSGLFVQGHYMKTEFGNAVDSGYWGQTSTNLNRKDADQWMIQAGISKNWFGIGNTAIYGEYSKSNDWGAGEGAGRSYNTNPASGAACVNGAAGSNIAGAVSVCGVTGTELKVWGVGITQNLDAAATTLYLSYRNFEADVQRGALSVDTDTFHAVIGGAVVRF